MKLNPKQLAASAALLGVLACAAALPASAAGPVTTPLALTLPKVSFPWDKVTAESIETGSYDAAPLAGTAQQLSPVLVQILQGLGMMLSRKLDKRKA